MVEKRRKKWTRAVCAGLVSAALHLFVVVPYGIARLLISHEQELEISYLPEPADAASEAPASMDRAEPLPPRPVLPPPEPPQDKKKLEELAKAPEPAKKKDEPKQPPKKEPPPLQVIPNAHLKMVDQDQFPDEQDNADAKYLAQKNHRAAKETRAQDTNLLRNQAGEQSSADSSNQQPKPGEKDQNIAELEDHKGRPDKLPINNPKDSAQNQTEGEQQRRSPLAMRDLVPLNKDFKQQEQKRDGVELQEPGPGPLPLQRNGQDEQAGEKLPRTGTQAHLGLSHEDYDRIVGFDVAQNERREAAQAQRSHTPGRWDRVQQKLAMMRSSLENFTPTVQPGNQSELGTRKHPFAAYIATMHRQIHKFWGFGFLSDLAGRPSNSPYNDMALWTGVEITLKPDGTVEKLIIVHPSGFAPFDVAAMDSVMSASPFPAPPESIKSRDGKVYLDWRFHRDDRQCATDFVSPHILTIPPKEPVPSPTPQAPQRMLAAVEPLRPLLSPKQRARAEDGALRQAQGDRGESNGERGESARPERGPEGAESKDGVPGPAREVAEKWLGAFTRGDVRWLAGYSATPFSAGGRTVAEDGDGVRAMYRQMLAEGTHHPGPLSFYTPAQIRKKLGRLPAGGDEDGMMFAMLKSGSDDLVLLLQEADQGWRVVGIDR